MITYLVTVQISCLKYNTVLQFRFFLIISQIKPTQLVAISQISFEPVVSPLSLFFEIYLLKTWSLLSRRYSHSWILLVASPRAWRTHSSVVCIFFKLLTAFLTLFFFFKIDLFIYGCAVSLLLPTEPSSVVASGGCSSLRCEGLSLQWFLLLWMEPRRPAGYSSWLTV